MNLNEQRRREERRRKSSELWSGICACLFVGLALVLIMFSIVEGMK